MRSVVSSETINCRNADGISPLHIVCISGRVDLAEFLLAHGADINSRDDEWWTPLHSAADIATMRFLLDHGANLHARTLDNDTVLDLARASDNEDADEIIQFLEQEFATRGTDESSDSSISSALVADISARVASGRSLDTRAEFGATLLHIAVANGVLDAVQLLIDNDANMELRDDEGLTPLHVAVVHSQVDVIFELCKRAVDPDVKTHSGQLYYELADEEDTELSECLTAVRAKFDQRKLDSAKPKTHRHSLRLLVLEWCSGGPLYPRARVCAVCIHSTLHSSRAMFAQTGPHSSHISQTDESVTIVDAFVRSKHFCDCGRAVLQ
eukprot:m.648239 g.648239  ORF g.648239 m.648239 type:complete len:326 (-) comp58384_c0_seq27:362-1339(-)